MRKVRNSIFFALILGVIAYLIIRVNSFSFALSSAGFYSHSVGTIARGYNANDQEFKVIQTSSKEHEIVLAVMNKNSMGFWKVVWNNENRVNSGLTDIQWINMVNGQFEWHRYYSGNNAVKHIAFLPGQIPENVTVGITQVAHYYSIHIVSFKTEEPINFDVEALLKENQFIPVE